MRVVRAPWRPGRPDTPLETPPTTTLPPDVPRGHSAVQRVSFCSWFRVREVKGLIMGQLDYLGLVIKAYAPGRADRTGRPVLELWRF